MLYKFTRPELINKNASDFKNGDTVTVVGSYRIQIGSGGQTTVFNLNTYKFLDHRNGVEWPYYIVNFINR